MDGRTVAAAALALLAMGPGAPAGAGPRSIVGEWARAPADCGTQFAFKVGPGSIVTDDLSCALPKVSRRGETVRFEGACDEGPGDVPETVVADGSGGRLTLRFLRSGYRLDGLLRCPAKGRN